MRNECLEKVTKFQDSISSRLGMAFKKPQGGPNRPPPTDNREESVMVYVKSDLGSAFHS